METFKINTSTIEVKETETKESINQYDYDFLIAQKAQIIKDANEYLNKRRIEITEIDVILAECIKLGITSATVTEPIK